MSSREITTTSLKSILRFPFHGRDWMSRFVIGVALTFANFVVPIIPSLFVSGYALRVMRRAIAGEEPALPPWEDWGGLLKDGLRGLVVSLVYLLPGTFVYFSGLLLYFVVMFSFPFFEAFAKEQRGLFVLFPLLFLVSMVALFISLSIGSLLVILGAIPLPVATAHFVAHDRVSAAFHVREWFRLLWANKLGYVVAFVVVTGLMAIMYIAMMLTAYTLILWPLMYLLIAPFGFYLSLVSTVLFGQTYRESVMIVGREG